MEKTDYSRICYNTKCSKHMKGNQCWYNESAISDCEGRIKADRRKSARGEIMNEIPEITPHICMDEMTNCVSCPQNRKMECFYRNDPDAEQRRAREAEKNRLIKLIDKAQIECDDNYGMTNSKQMADFLLENGVIVAPFMVGDKVYVVPTAQTPFKEVIEATVLRRKASTIDNYIIRYFAHLVYEIDNPYTDDGTKMTCGIDAVLGAWAEWNCFYLTRDEAEAVFQDRKRKQI